jgi:2-polyprenyl-3-methyl-5-hydroxy-6-metoxy-1,4-benzoquinol methylase
MIQMDKVTTWSIEDEIREVVDLAQIHCGECRDYHISRSCLKFGGVERGPERDRELFAPLLARNSPIGARVLIAGAADAGLLDFVLKTIGPRNPKITVVDLCKTPLILCEKLAAAHSVEIETRVANLVNVGDVGTFDVIIAHLVLPFIAAEHRRDFLANLATMLAPRGAIISALKNAKERHRQPVLARLLEAMSARGMEPPEKGTVLFEALRRFESEPLWPHDVLDGASPEIEELFASAGLQVVERHDSASSTASKRPPRRYIVCKR